MKVKPRPPSLKYGIFLTIFAYFLYAIGSACVKLLGNFSTIKIVFFQTFISLICLLPLLLKTNLKPISISAHLVRGLAGTLSYFAYFLAIKYINLIDATVLNSSAPFYIPIFWSIWTKEKMEKGIWYTIFLGFIGILFILKPGSEIFHMGSFVGIAAGIIAALALTAIGVLNKRGASVLNILFYYFLISSLVTLPFVIYYWTSLSVMQWILLFGVGLTTFFGQILQTKAYKHGTAAFLSPLSYSLVIFTSLISWLFFHKPPGWLSFLGMLFIIIGGSLSYIIKKKPSSISEALSTGYKSPSWWKFWKKTPKN